MTRPLALRLLLVALAATALSQTPAAAQVTVNIGFAPPEIIREERPTIAPGYVWAPGYWAWHGDDYIWMRGRTLTQRAGYRWEPDSWERSATGYVRREGRWEREPQSMAHDNRNNGNGNGYGNGKDHDRFKVKMKKDKGSKHSGQRKD